MKKSILITSALLVSGVLGAAEADSTVSFKIRGLAGLETTDGVRNGFGFGLNYAVPVGPGSANFELGYQNFSGKQYRQSVAPNTLGILTDGDPKKINSVDSRKNSLAGFSFRGSYLGKISTAWSWQAGVALMSLKSHHESVVSFTGTAGKMGNWDIPLDKTYFTASPYAGVRFDMDEIGALEFNVILASYKTATLEPSIGATTVTPVTGDKTVTKAKIEIGYVFKF